MSEFSKNIHTEKMSRRDRARVLGVQSVIGALNQQHMAERPIPEPVEAATQLMLFDYTLEVTRGEA